MRDGRPAPTSVHHDQRSTKLSLRKDRSIEVRSHHQGWQPKSLGGVFTSCDRSRESVLCLSRSIQPVTTYPGIWTQYTKYPCVKGSSSLGSAVQCIPSASTRYVSGSTFILGRTSLYFMSRLPMFLQFLTASMRFRSPYDLMTPESMDALDTNVTDDDGTIGANIERMMTGSTVGMDALGSPWTTLVTVLQAA